MDSDQELVGPWVIVERGFELCRWDVAEVAVQSGGVVPVHPPEEVEIPLAAALFGLFRF